MQQVKTLDLLIVKKLLNFILKLSNETDPKKLETAAQEWIKLNKAATILGISGK